MMSKILAAATVLTLGAGMAAADAMTDSIQRDLAQQGFKNIEFSTDDGQLKVEAQRGNQSIELVYDSTTGELISRDGAKTTGLERAEQVSGKTLPQGKAGRDDDDRDDKAGRDDDSRDDATDDSDDDRDDSAGDADDDSSDDDGADDSNDDSSDDSGDDDGSDDDGRS